MNATTMVQTRWKSLGPIVLSVLSFCTCIFILKPIVRLIDPSLNLFASRGFGKIALTTLVVLHILLLIRTQSSTYIKQWLKTNVLFLGSSGWLVQFSKYFLLFFSLHALMLATYFGSGFMTYNPAWGNFSLGLVLKTLFGLLVTFFLAWSEELIFRGTIYTFFNQHLPKLESALYASIIFMLCHDLTNPLNMVTTHWQLGLGLFLLGFMLNMIFVVTNKLYTGMGVHAGLVFVKVVLRRARFLLFLPAAQLPWWLHSDLRYAHITHLLFMIVIAILLIVYQKQQSTE